MSGGSYNYLCFNTDNVGGRRSDLAEMAERLEGLEWAGHAAAATRRLVVLLDLVEQEAASLSDVWHAIEWWDSCDWGKDQAREKVEPWRPAAPVEYRGPDPLLLYRLVDAGAGIFELRPVERETAVVTLVDAVQTCTACPSQWDAWDATGQYYYLRYRSGRGTVETAASSTAYVAAGPISLVAEFMHGDGLDGEITLKEFAELAGLQLKLQPRDNASTSSEGGPDE